MSTDTTNHQYCCSKCHLSFATKLARKSHKQATHPLCRYCSKQFNDLERLQSHQRETSHLYCSECDLHFPRRATHAGHVRAVRHIAQYHCCDCNRDYISQISLDNHCCDCGKVFRSSKGLSSHFGKHQAHIPLVKDLQVRRNRQAPRKCRKCNEEFPTEKALNKHRLIHKPKRCIPCPGSIACKKMFITPSGMLDHIESGRCRSGMTRAKLHGLVLAHDQSHHITDMGVIDVANSIEQESSRYSSACHQSLTANKISQLSHTRSPSILASLGQLNLIEDETNANINGDTASERSIVDEVSVRTPLSDSGSDWSSLGGVPLQPTPSESASEWSLMSPIHTPTASHVSDIDLAGISETVLLQNLQCPRCPPSRKRFCNSAALSAHLSSAAHAPKIFHCPLMFAPELPLTEKPKKEKHFTTLGGLARHLESGACQGGAATFVNVMKYVQEQLGSLGFKNVKLLLD